MTELVLGVLGVVPLTLLIFEAHKSAKQKLKTFREYDDEAERLQKEFDIQRRLFRNEWKILLSLITEDNRLVNRLGGDFSYKNWSDPELNEKLQNVLDQNYDTYFAILKDIYTASHDLELELERINSPDEVPEETVSEKKVLRKLRRVQDGIRVVRHSKEFAASMEKLKSDIGQLIALRSQLERLTEPDKRAKASAMTRSAAIPEVMRTWKQCTQTRKASTTLHSGLAEVWKCGQADHSKHLFKLFVETGELQGEIQIRLAIIYGCQTPAEIRSGLARLEVRSRDMTWEEQPCPTAPKADESVPRHAKRLKVVRFEETTSSIPVSYGSSTSARKVDDDMESLASSDLRFSQDICWELTRTVLQSPSPPPSSVTSVQDPACLGHIEILSQPKFRHTFFSEFAPAPYGISAPEPSTIGDIISHTRRDLVDSVDKLRLARSMAMAVLKFHSTPWLGQVWQLQDMAMFVDDVEDLSQSLETLHVNVELTTSCPAIMEGVQGAPESDCPADEHERTDEEILCNIKNRPLYSLGVAFLQIDRWARLDLGDVVKVRKAAEFPSSISKKFHYLTQRCLECNFGHGPGTDLSKAVLQKAVCRDVVAQLDGLILLAKEMNLVEPTDDGE